MTEEVKLVQPKNPCLDCCDALAENKCRSWTTLWGCGNYCTWSDKLEQYLSDQQVVDNLQAELAKKDAEISRLKQEKREMIEFLEDNLPVQILKWWQSFKEKYKEGAGDDSIS